MRDRDLCNMLYIFKSSEFLYLTDKFLSTAIYTGFETGIRDESKFDIPKECLDVSISYLILCLLK